MFYLDTIGYNNYLKFIKVKLVKLVKLMTNNIHTQDVHKAQKLWGDGLVKIGELLLNQANKQDNKQDYKQ